MALIKCPECGKENVSNTAMACPYCGFAIREFFNEKSEDQTNFYQIKSELFNKKLEKQKNSYQIESELAKICAKLDEFYIREGAYWYKEDRSTYDFFNMNGYMTESEAIKCNQPRLGYYECLKYLEEKIIEAYNICKNTTYGMSQYNEFVCGLFKILSFDKYDFLPYGSTMYLYNILHVEILERDTILEIAKQNATGIYTIWSAGELNILFKKLNAADQRLCISYFGQKYKPQLTNDVDIEGLYQKWLEYKNQDKEFDENWISFFKGKRNSMKMSSQSFPDIDEKLKSSNQNNQNKYIPKCPTCGSPDIKKISGVSKALWGIFSQKVHKQWRCNNCDNEW